ncbi:MAG: protein kinase [Chloracidobacterium sp.]|nr:protein kinase [Chloracidobacterium sp.]
MSTETKKRQKLIFKILEEALQSDQDQQASILIQRCAGDQALLYEVKSLLEASTKMGSFLGAPQSMKPFERPSAEEAETEKQHNPVGNTKVRIGHFEIDGLLGEGGMGKVYLATDTKLGRVVALKILSAQLTGDRDFVKRFEGEARILAKLDHPNIIKVYEIGLVEGVYYIATEYVKGRTLETMIRNMEMELADGLDIIAQVANALEASHTAGVIHRDVKPSNIMVRHDGAVKVLDFGVAKQTGQQPGEGLSVAGAVIGTIRYMSPEQIRGENVDRRSDIFSLGVVLYELVTGSRPFPGASATVVRENIISSSAKRLIDHVPDLPVELQSIVDKALAKRPLDRYQDVSTLRDHLLALKRKLNGSRGSEEAPPMIRRSLLKIVASYSRRHPLIAAAVLLLFALVSVWSYKFLNPPIVLRLSGSDTIGNKLMPDLVAEFFRTNGKLIAQYENKISKTVLVKGIFRGDIFPKVIEIRTHGTNEAFRDSVAKVNDIGMASRQITVDEQTRLGGDAATNDYIIGHDGVAIIVNNNNEINELTVEQVGKIFRHKITSWGDLGPVSEAPRCGKINTYIRNKESGTREFVKQVLLSGEDFAVLDPAQEINDNMLLAEKVGSDPCGIGFVPRPFMSLAKPVVLVDDKGKKHIISSFSIASNDYILARPLYLYVRSDSQNDLATNIADFCLGNKGQAIVNNDGFVKLDAHLGQALPAPDAPQGYIRLTNEAEKLSLYIPFQRGDSRLSDHAKRTIQKAVEFFTLPQYKARKIVVVGHGDSAGSPAGTYGLSEKRAKAVVEELKKAGITVADTLFYGSRIPAVAYKAGEDQEKNRRVEFWLKK